MDKSAVRYSCAASVTASINSSNMSESSDKSAARHSSAVSVPASNKVTRPWSELTASVSKDVSSPRHKVQKVVDEPKIILAEDVIDDMARTLMNLGLEKGPVAPNPCSDKCGVRGCTFSPYEGFCSQHKALHEAMLPKIRELMAFAKNFTVARDRKTSMPDDEIAAIIGKNPEDLFVASSHVDTILQRLEMRLPPDYGTEAIAIDLQELAQRDFGLPDDRYLRAVDTIRIVEAFQRLDPHGSRFPMKSLLLKSTLNLHPLEPYERFFGHSWCYHGSSGPHISKAMASEPDNVRSVVSRWRKGYVLHPPARSYGMDMRGGAAFPHPGAGGAGVRRPCSAVLVSMHNDQELRSNSAYVERLSSLLAGLGSAGPMASGGGGCASAGAGASASGAGHLDGDADQYSSDDSMDVCEEDDVDSIS